MTGRMKRGYLWVLKNTLNRLTLRLARWGHGPFTLLRHTGRITGKQFETPLILAAVPGGFVAELTYGPGVNWYRNLVAGGEATVVRGRSEWSIVGVEVLDRDSGLAAFRLPASAVLRLLRRREFRILRTPTGAAHSPE
jgi:deazaflavin-dependent oxidoreductase (nitroreductase family)